MAILGNDQRAAIRTMRHTIEAHKYLFAEKINGMYLNDKRWAGRYFAWDSSHRVTKIVHARFLEEELNPCLFLRLSILFMTGLWWLLIIIA